MDKADEKKKKWTEEEERILSDIVLSFTIGGKTQREAFEKAAHTIGRTPGACSFRWNNKLKSNFNTDEDTNVLKQPTLADCITFLKTLETDEGLIAENTRLKEEQAELKKRLHNEEETFVELKKRHKVLLFQIDTLNTSLHS
ncbi:hypothetical protein FZC78_00665 [Rossellomorea vietnamensis]|uniref:Myb-like domain-containing protein n=1 Tax=Rossellomorea vietnamensis TaxID=218284 RepID=A0A5D4NZ12_9BACI|nr:hypothetical protein [Rossellomorea vietnamensis]TYS19577.1 hypothetical protein FZC78_00665 [Rossellomorea vietnamensis]